MEKDEKKEMRDFALSNVPVVSMIDGSKFGDGNGEDGKHYWL